MSQSITKPCQWPGCENTDARYECGDEDVLICADHMLMLLKDFKDSPEYAELQARKATA
jgi:hypothetical protein